ncbi:MAG: hypothetical protein CL416_04585 [Acidimicrobiaceae bacterium]|nr:hypothetical protein [Acidimicrobiaceae bacterium]
MYSGRGLRLDGYFLLNEGWLDGAGGSTISGNVDQPQQGQTQPTHFSGGTWSGASDQTGGTVNSDRGPLFEIDAIADGHALPRVLIAALEETSSPVCITTADLDAPGPTIVYVNPAYSQMTRRNRADVIGRSPRIMQGPLTDRAVLDRLRDDLAGGRPFSGETINYRADGEPFHIAWSIDPVLDDHGVATHYVATQRDVTAEVVAERVRLAEEGLDTALVDALGSPSDTEAALALLLDAVAVGAGRVTGYGTAEVTLRDPALGPLRASADTSAEPPTNPNVTVEVRVPMTRVDGVTIGRITIGNLRVDERNMIDRPSLNRVAERAAAVITGLAEYQRQRRTALRLQEAMLPRVDVAPDGFEIVSRYIPGDDGVYVGGDWFDVIETPTAIVLVVGDVSGHGIEAATTMARLQILTAAEIRAGRPIDQVFDVLDRACRDDATMATMTLATISTGSEEALIWSAGHLPPVCFGPSGATLVSVCPTPPLGHLRGEQPTATTTPLSDGESLLFFTDGLVEQRREPLPEGLDRLCAALARAVGPLDDIVDSVIASRSTEDDTAVVAVRRRPSSEEEESLSPR